MNLPNKLTTLRMIMVIPFLIFGILFISYDGSYSFTNLNLKTIFFLTALVIFAFAMMTDWADGYLARKRKIVTSYGKLFDPLADKLMTTTALILLSIDHLVPVWIVVLMVIRDIVVDGSRNLLAKNNQPVAASMAGKIKTVLQSFGIIFIFIMVPALGINGSEFVESNKEIMLINIPMYLALIMSWYSGAIYVRKTIPYINMK